MRVIVLKRKPLVIMAVIITLSSFSFFFKQEAIVSVLTKNLKPIYSTKTSTNKIALTFDISWGRTNVVPVLEILAKENVKATFFLSSPWSEENQDLAEKIIASGNEIGSHGRKHVDMNKLNQNDLEMELVSAQATLEKLTNKKITMFRPPNGAYDNKVINTATAHGQRVIQWSIDSLDWKRPGREAVIRNVLLGRKGNNGAKPGDIILFHASDSAPDTPSALPEIITVLKNKGYELVTVSDLLMNSSETWPPESQINQ